MKNLISYKKSGLSALRKAFSLIVVLCTYLQGVNSQELIVDGWYNVEDEGESASKVVPIDECGVVYRVDIVTTNTAQNRQFIIKYKESGSALNEVTSDISTSVLTLDNNQEGKPRCRFTIVGGEKLSSFFLNLSNSKIVVTETEPADADAVKITASSTKTANLGSKITYTAKFCSSNKNSDLTYKWQISNGTTWVDATDPSTEKTYEYTVMSDIKAVRCVASYTDPLGEVQTINSNAIDITTNKPTFDVVIEGEGVRNINSIEKEVPSWRDVVIKMVDLPSANVSNPKISFKEMGEGKKYSALTEAELSDDKTSWSFYANKSGWMKVEVDVEVPASDGTSKTVSLENEFMFRLVYSPDKEDAVQELFFDDFGYFTGNEYHYVKYNSGEITDKDAVETLSSTLPSNVKWMSDQNGFIKEHKFALDDKKVISRLPLDSDGKADRSDCWNGTYTDENRPYQCWCENGYRIEDGYYAFVPNPAMADGGAKDSGESDYWDGTDHTGSADGTKQGAMLMVNCADVLGKVIYERDFEITGECTNVMVLFSAFVSNAQSLTAGGSPVNIRMDIYEKGGTEVLTSIESGDVITRNYGPNSWSNLTALFPLSNGDDSKGSKFYTLKITNNAASGSGNDILLDDISLKVCFPEIEVEANVGDNEILEKNKIVICGKNRDLTLRAFNRAGIKNYIPNPSYLFQYFDDATEKWINLPKSASDLESAIQDVEYLDITLGKDGFNSDTKFRVVVGNSPKTIVKLVTDGIPNPDCEYTYAISDTFFVNFKPVGEDLSLFGCIGETIAVNADANGRPTISWMDYAGNALTVNDSIKSIKGDKLEFVIPESILNANKMSDTLYMLATTEGGLCTDTQIVAITKYDDLDFKFANDTFYCEFDSSIKAIDVYPTSGINYEWTLNGASTVDQTGSVFKVNKSTPEVFDNTVSVTGTATGYCPITKTTEFSIYRRYSLSLTVDVEGKDEKVANLCLPTDGTSTAHVDLKVEKVFADKPAPSHEKEKVTTYFWYRKDRDSKDSTLIHEGTETSIVDRLQDNNIYTYSVTALDEVCYKDKSVATSDSTIINARKPLIVKLTEDKTELCKDDDVTLTVKLSNALNADTLVSNLFENDSELTSLVGFPKADTTNTHTYTPKNKTKEKATKNIRVEVMDMICSPTKPISDEVSFDVFVPLVVSLSSDANNGTKCIRKDLKDDSVNVTLTVEQGNPRSIEWFDGKYPGLVFKRPVTVSADNNGVNKISVKAFDDVCRTSEAAAFVEGADTAITVIAQEPIEISLAADKDSICNGDPVQLTMNVKNSLVIDPVVNWFEKYDGAELLAYKDMSTSSVKNHVPENKTDFAVEKTMIVKTIDEICNSGNEVAAEVSYKILIPIKLKLLHDADLNGTTIQKCIREDNVDDIVNLEVKVTEGNPNELIWSDNKYVGLVYKREFHVSPGTNSISVVATDGVCPASANDKDALDIVAATPIVLTLEAKNPDVCDGSDVVFDLTVENSLDPTNVEVKWYDEGTEVYTTNGATISQNHTSSNSTTAKLNKTMDVKVDDDICSLGTKVTTSADYTVFKPVQFNLTSDAIEFGVKNKKCLGQTSAGSQTSAEIQVNLTQGNPVKFVWSDDVVWEWSWDGSSTNTTSRTFNLSRGKNTLSVVAYDNVCNKEDDETYKGQGENIDIEARTPIKVTLALASGRDVMCKGEDISLVATVLNEMDGEKTMLEWNENHGVENGLVENGSYTTDVFTPTEGKKSYRVKASEDAETPICPSQIDSLPVSVQVNTTLRLYVSDDAICQDTSGKDTVALVKLTAHVLTGSPKGIIWSTGDTTKMVTNHDSCYSFLSVAPMENIVYSAYGYDDVCVKTTTAYADEIDVDHRVYVTLSAEDYKVQMGNEVEFKTEYSIPADGVRYYEMVSPEETELERNHDSELNWQLDEPGRYQFIVKLDNGNCGIRNSNVITVDVADYVVVPNVITPYNDNPKNDKFMEGYDVKIFNRYQETVYEGTEGWDATYRGELASPGTYFYILTKKDGRVLKGTVEVYRK